MAKDATKTKNNRRGDTTSRTTKPPSDPELQQIRQEKILPILQELQSPEQAKRLKAASAIGSLIDNEKCRKLLLREQVVRIVLERLVADSNLDTRTAGWDILQHLAVNEEADFCVHLSRLDVLTGAEKALQDVSVEPAHPRGELIMCS